MFELTKQEHDILNNGFNKLKDDAFIQFAKGKEEHGGSLKDKPCYYFKKSELIDLLVYELFDNEQRNKAIAICDNLLAGKVPSMELFAEIRKVKNILEYGNGEGKIYNE